MKQMARRHLYPYDQCASVVVDLSQPYSSRHQQLHTWLRAGSAVRFLRLTRIAIVLCTPGISFALCIPYELETISVQNSQGQIKTQPQRRRQR